MTGPGAPLDALAGRGFARIADARQSVGNDIRLLCDGPQNFPLWLDAIAGAQTRIDLENYILEDDSVGGVFADALVLAAGRGVRCRVVYDWLGCRRRTTPAFWKRLRSAGVALRCYNPPQMKHPLGWINRDHRKVLCVDGRIAFTGGLCIGHDWMGDESRGIPAWRDTGIAIRGPAVADVEAAFEDSWRAAGGTSNLAPPIAQTPPAAGELKAWVIAGRPDSMGLYRLEQLVAEIAERSLWLTDAYFVATTAYVHALCEAARNGVDVRLLVPGSTNFPMVGALSRVGYRPLLEAGVRVFEWNGPMLHAKTAVADGCWSRVGSSNSNLASWFSNRELDVTIHDHGFAREMEAAYERDLTNATEVVLETRRFHIATAAGDAAGAGETSRYGRLLAGAVGAGSAAGAALSRRRALGRAEAGPLAIGGLALAALAFVAIWLPRLIAYPLALLAAWAGLALLGRAWKLRGAQPAEKPSSPAQ
jgi:cardiolipin synthase